MSFIENLDDGMMPMSDEEFAKFIAQPEERIDYLEDLDSTSPEIDRAKAAWKNIENPPEDLSAEQEKELDDEFGDAMEELEERIKFMEVELTIDEEDLSDPEGDEDGV